MKLSDLKTNRIDELLASQNPKSKKKKGNAGPNAKPQAKHNIKQQTKIPRSGD